MKTVTIILSVCLLFAATIITISSCDKSSDSSTLQVRLTDAPAAFEEVNVDITEVRVKFYDDGKEDNWVNLQTTAGIYNLLALQGIDTSLATGTFPTDYTVKEIRLVLGTDNTIKVGGVTHPLTIPSGSESGLKLKINKELKATVETVVVDFDAALSVHTNGTGDYILSPVLKIK